MKTVQDFLREVDDKELADAYFSEFPIEYAMIPKTDLTLGEIRDRSRTHFLEFVHRMRETKTEPGSSVFLPANITPMGIQTSSPRCVSWKTSAPSPLLKPTPASSLTSPQCWGITLPKQR